MTDQSCEMFRELLPGLVHGRLEPEERSRTEAHLAECGECRREGDLLATVFRHRPEPPSDLEDRIRTRVWEEFGTDGGSAADVSGIDLDRGDRRPRLPLFGKRFPIPGAVLPAAAVVVLALGTALLWTPGSPDVEQEPIQVVLTDDPLPEAYLWDDGLVAGAPLLDGLSEDDLVVLLEELEGEA